MKGAEKVKMAFERNAKALSLRPSLGQGTAITRVKWLDGLACEVEEGKWKFTADMGEKSGGTNTGPNPGILGRAALGTCLVVGYAMYAAKRNVSLNRLEVEVQADYDSRGYHGVDNVKPGYNQIRYIVTIESDAPEGEVLAMLEEADQHSDFLHVFAEPQDVQREVRLVRTEK